MFTTIARSIDWPLWARTDERYKRLDILDRLLGGTFYDHLKWGFHEEEDLGSRYVPIIQRRPSVQYNLPRQVAIRCARKLFAGRQRPRLVHDSRELVESGDLLMREGFLDQRIVNAAVWGSVGSVAMTFKILPDGQGSPRIIYDVWRAKHCVPSFDALGELTNLRVQYVTVGVEFLSNGVLKDSKGNDIRPRSEYWFVRDYTTDAEITYFPINTTDHGLTITGGTDELRTNEDLTVKHSLGFVPGHWFVNLSGGNPPDGTCTWSPAIPTAITMDYTLSQLARGLWYNAAPQTVIKGDLKNEGDDTRTVQRSPANILHFEADRKTSAGDSLSGGDAKLLEMQGTGMREGREYVERLRHYALEQIQSSRKDPDRLSGTAMSGKAMEILEEDFLDLTQELRTSYGENGLLPLLRKSLRAAEMMNHPAVKTGTKDVDGLCLQWPKPYAPSAQEFVQFSQALIELVKPVGWQSPEFSPKGNAVLSERPGSNQSAPGEQDSASSLPPKGAAEKSNLGALLTIEEARAILESYIDIPRSESDGIGRQQIPSESDPTEPGFGPKETP